jgi:hypothetical protein
MSGELVTLELVKQSLDVGGVADELLELVIRAVTAEAESIAGRFLPARDVLLRLDGNGRETIRLPSFPVNAVSRLCVDPARAFPAGNDIPPDQYSIREDVIFLYGRETPRARDCVLFEGNIGYIEIPADLQTAALEAVSANLWRLQGSNSFIKNITVPNGITTTYQTDIPLPSKKVFRITALFSFKR